MKAVTQIQKVIERFSFLTSSIYERYDLRGIVSPGEKAVIRQGDLIVTNYPISYLSTRGLMRAYLRQVGKYYVFRESHIILPMENNTLLFHAEHGIVILPFNFESLYFYTFTNGAD